MYIETTGNTLKELITISGLSINIYNYERYMDIKPDSNQSSHLYWTAKIQKFENLEDIIKPKLKFSLIVDQTETFTYSGAGGGGGGGGGVGSYIRLFKTFV